MKALRLWLGLGNCKNRWWCVSLGQNPKGGVNLWVLASSAGNISKLWVSPRAFHAVISSLPSHSLSIHLSFYCHFYKLFPPTFHLLLWNSYLFRVFIHICQCPFPLEPCIPDKPPSFSLSHFVLSLPCDGRRFQSASLESPWHMLVEVNERNNLQRHVGTLWKWKGWGKECGVVEGTEKCHLWWAQPQRPAPAAWAQQQSDPNVIILEEEHCASTL